MTARKRTSKATKPASDKTDDDSGELDLIDVELIERTPETTTFAVAGQKFSFPTSQAKWPTRSLQFFQRKQNADGIELLLGPAQWARFNDVAPLAEHFWQFWGVFLGTVNGTAPKDDEPAKDDADAEPGS